MISACWSSGRSATTVGVGERIAHALGVREVGAEHDVVDRDAEVDEALGVGLVEGVDPDVAVEDLDGVLVEEHRALVVVPLELGVEGPDPRGGVLDRHEPQLREPGGEAVPDDRGHGVDEVVLLRRQREERRRRTLPPVDFAVIVISRSPRPSHSFVYRV